MIYNTFNLFLETKINLNSSLLILTDQRYKISINEWLFNVRGTASVVAHEIGHAIGMDHDFGRRGTNDTRYDTRGNICTGIDGIMDYGRRSNVDKFTNCSKEDFKAWHNRVIQTYGVFCLTCGMYTILNL